MKRKIFLSLVSIFLTFAFLEFILRFFNIPNESNKDFQRKDLAWTEKNVVLNSAGYRDKEYPIERQEDTFRIYAVGDSYTYGWLVDDQQKTYTEIIENKLGEKAGKKVEVINAGSPGFSIDENVKRFISEGKYYYPDLVIVGINDDEANYTKTYQQPTDNKLNKLIRGFHLYQISLGNYFKSLSEKANHDYVLNIYTDKDSEEWKKFADQLLLLKNEANKINSQLAIVLFPHIHPNKPNDPYDYFPFNEKFKQFGEENDIITIDPLEGFLKYQNKKDLVINPLDPHPTAKMNKIVADSFLKQFDIQGYLSKHTPYVPVQNQIEISADNKSLGPYKLIKSIKSDSPIPWTYFETKNGVNIQNFPLKDTSSRKTNFYIDELRTAKSFTHTGIVGATIEYHLYPEEKGIINVPLKLYGYDVVGINHIFALSISEEGNISSDYIVPESIIQNDQGFKVKFDPEKNYHNYRVSLSVATKQMDINPEGSIEYTIATEVLTKKAEEETQTIFFPVSKKISSWQVFSEKPGENQVVALIDGKMVKVSEIKTDETGITLRFLPKIKAGQEVKFAIARQYDLVDDSVKIDFE